MIIVIIVWGLVVDCRPRRFSDSNHGNSNGIYYHGISWYDSILLVNVYSIPSCGECCRMKEWAELKEIEKFSDLISFSFFCSALLPVPLMLFYAPCNSCRFVGYVFASFRTINFFKVLLNPDAVRLINGFKKSIFYWTCCRQFLMQFISITDINYKIRSAKCNGTILDSYLSRCVDWFEELI